MHRKAKPKPQKATRPESEFFIHFLPTAACIALVLCIAIRLQLFPFRPITPPVTDDTTGHPSGTVTPPPLGSNSLSNESSESETTPEDTAPVWERDENGYYMDHVEDQNFDRVVHFLQKARHST